MYAYKLIEKEKFIYYNFTKDICSVVKKRVLKMKCIILDFHVLCVKGLFNIFLRNLRLCITIS